MIRQPPEYVPSEMALAADDHHPQRQVVPCVGVPARDQGQEDHAHRLLRVLEAVPQRQRGGGDGLASRNPRWTLFG